LSIGDHERKARQVGLLPPPSICEKSDAVDQFHFVSSLWSLSLGYSDLHMPFPLFSGLGPGAQSLIKKITDSNLPDSERIDNVKKIVREMTIQDWNVLVKAFDEWPFAPEVCHAQLFVEEILSLMLQELSIGDSMTG
jgi:hypothetical protein